MEDRGRGSLSHALRHAAILIPLAAGGMSWVIVMWYSGEDEAFDAALPYWTVSLVTALLLGAVLGAPRERPFEKTNYRRSPPLSVAPRFRPLELGIAMAIGQIVIGTLMAEEHTLWLVGATMLLALGVIVFSPAAAAGVLLRQLVLRHLVP